MFCVAKQNQLDQSRFVTDCCLRNIAIYKKPTPLFNIDELIELVATYPVCSKIDVAESQIDLANRYFNIRVEESSEKCNTLLTTHHKMRSRIMSQGDCNTPDTTMEAILDIFKDVVYKCLLINIDDIIIYSRKCEEHVRDLKNVLQRLEE